MNKEEKIERPLTYYPHRTISCSALQSFEACPVAFFLHYYYGIDFPASEKMIAGSKFQEALNAKYAGQDYGAIIETIPDKLGSTAKELIEQAYSFDDILTLDSEYIVDFGVGIPVKFIPDILLKGKDGYTVIENKFSGGYYNKDSIQKQMQGRIYYYGIYRLFNEYPLLKYQIFDNKKKTVELIELKYSDGEIAEMINWMMNILNKIKKSYESGKWVTKSHGKFSCGLGKACPALN